MHKNLRAVLDSKLGCRYHPDAYLFEDNICEQCGLLVDNVLIDTSAEWRTFMDDDKGMEKSRVGSAENRLLGAANLSTSIENVRGGYNDYGRAIIKTNERRSVDHSLLAAFKQISTMADRINLPNSVVDRAKYFYQQQMLKRSLKGNILTKNAKTAACLYIACCEEDVPRTVREICAVTEDSQKEITKAIGVVKKALNLDVKRIESEQLVTRFCGKMQLPFSITKEATRILEDLHEKEKLKNKFPESVAAASIYVATAKHPEYRVSKQEISEQAGIAASTVTKTYNLMLKEFR